MSDTKIVKKRLTIGIESKNLSVHDWLVILKKMHRFLVIELQDYENKATVGYKFENIPIGIKKELENI